MDWTSSMKQTYEFYEVNPTSWNDIRQINSIVSCSINIDESSDTYYSASFTATEMLDEMYVRVYLIAVQNGGKTKIALGTFLVQSPSYTFNGVYASININAYSPLIELKEKKPRLGYTIRKGAELLNTSVAQMDANLRAPVSIIDDTLVATKNITAESGENWLSFLAYTFGLSKRKIVLDGYGKVGFVKETSVDKMNPSAFFDDGNSSILYPSITDDRDWYGIPNVVEVYYGNQYYSRIVNDEESSPTSTVNRGREILYRETAPNVPAISSQEDLDRYATRLLEELSSLEHRVTFSHGYCETKVGDCIMLNYKLAGMTNVKARIINQTISCVPGCKVDETAVYTTSLWRANG